AFIFLYTGIAYKIVELSSVNTAVAAVLGAGLTVFSATAYKALKLMVLGDVLKASGVLKEGDYVVVGGKVARITDVQATHTVLTTSDLRKIYVPNDQLLSEKFANMTKSGAGVLTVRIKIDTRRIGVSDAKLILLKTGTDLAKGEAAPNRAAEVRVEKIEGDYVTLRLTLYLINPAKAEPLASHIMERVHAKLYEATAEARI
ncbi:MAG: mechanosensitive ion channel family protein, partial [Candidatus Caldarchaeum sp.]|nr:mechanosensitive ion channel family protein [Candidatus Caldarchaeum sp.]MDW8434917.1 mechanosensitive ion channel [Candidatus Caldarchaeum sp.]